MRFLQLMRFVLASRFVRTVLATSFLMFFGLMLARYAQVEVEGPIAWVLTVVANAIAVLVLWINTRIHKEDSKREDGKAKLENATDVLPLPLSDEKGVVGPSWILNSDNRVVPFADHNADRAKLDKWYGAQRPRIVFVRGPAGVGKTRLISEWADGPKIAGVRRVRLGSEHGVVGLAETDADDVTLVVDLTVPRPGLRSVIDDLARFGDGSTRLILECRTQFPIDYVRTLVGEPGRTLLDEAHRIDLTPSIRSSDVERWTARANAAMESVVLPPGPFVAVAPVLRVPSTFRDVTESALIACRGGVGVDSTTTQALFDHERAVWRAGALAMSPPMDPTVAETCIGLLTLVGADGEEDAVAALQRLPELADALSERMHQIVQWIHKLYPGTGSRGWVGSIEPSSVQYMLCGEYLDSADLRMALIASADSAEKVGRAMSTLVPASELYPHLADELGRLLTSAIDSNLPECVLAAVLACDIDAADRAMTHAINTGGVDAAVVEVVSDLLGNTLLSTRIALAERAVRDSSNLGDSVNLASVLDELADASAATGRLERALEVAIDSLEMYKRLYISTPGLSLRYRIARLSFRIGTLLYEGGRLDGARVYLDESQAAFAALRAECGPAYAGGHALAISGLALIDLAEGRADRGLASLDDAVVLARSMLVAEDRQGAPDLPRVLAMRAYGRATCGPWDEGLQAILAEAVQANRLQAERGDVFDIQNYLNTLHYRVIASNRHSSPTEKDLGFAGEVVEIVREYSLAGREAYEFQLSEALMNYAAMLCLVGSRSSDAVEVAVEALTIERRVADSGRTRFPMNVARGYLLLGFAYLRSDELGRAATALDRSIIEFRRPGVRQLGVEAMRKHGGALLIAARCQQLQSQNTESSRLLADALEHFRACEVVHPGIFRAELAMTLYSCAIACIHRGEALVYLDEALELFAAIDTSNRDVAEHYRLATSHRTLLLDELTTGTPS